MAKECPFRLTQADKECQKNDGEFYLKYKMGEKGYDVEIKECVLIAATRFAMPRSGAIPIE
jgi:hypothetical protein